MSRIPLLIQAEKAISQLLQFGETPKEALVNLSYGTQLGLWYLSSDHQRFVASTKLCDLLKLLSEQEAKIAVFACDPDIRAQWLPIVAAKLKEIGGRKDSAGLCQSIETLEVSASKEVLAILDKASMAKTSYSELEHKLFASYANDHCAYPSLLRAIASTSTIVETPNVANALVDVDEIDPEPNWIKGRLILFPGHKTSNSYPKSAILSGCYKPLRPGFLSQITSEEIAKMYWVLTRPWSYLLAQLVYVQEIWSAERITGSLSLILEEENIRKFDCPPRVLVRVTLPDEQEVNCGSLGELLLRVLENLGVNIFFSKVDAKELDKSLAPVIEQMLKAKVWRFNYRNWNNQTTYSIDNKFSDSCYRILGSKYFHRASTKVTNTFRYTCEDWARRLP